MIRVRATIVLVEPPQAAFDRILDLDAWPGFRGWGPIPGIRAARYTVRLDGVVGSRIEVDNLDGTTHHEEVVAWDPPHQAALRIEPAAPLGRLARSVHERWTVRPAPGGAEIVRDFELEPGGLAGRLLGPIIAWMLGRAMRRQLRGWSGA